MPSDLEQFRSYIIYLRIIQLALGFASVGLVVNYSNWTAEIKGMTLTFIILDNPNILSFLINTATYLTPSFLLLFATINKDSYEHLRKSIFELVYNISGAIIQGINSTVFLIVIGSLAPPHIATYLYIAGILGMFNAFFYFASFYLSVKARKA